MTNIGFGIVNSNVTKIVPNEIEPVEFDEVPPQDWIVYFGFNRLELVCLAIESYLDDFVAEAIDAGPVDGFEAHGLVDGVSRVRRDGCDLAPAVTEEVFLRDIVKDVGSKIHPLITRAMLDSPQGR